MNEPTYTEVPEDDHIEVYRDPDDYFRLIDLKERFEEVTRTHDNLIAAGKPTGEYLAHYVLPTIRRVRKYLREAGYGRPDIKVS